METILEGRMGCISIMCIYSFALHTRVLCDRHSAMQWDFCTWRPHTFFSGKRRQINHQLCWRYTGLLRACCL